MNLYIGLMSGTSMDGIDAALLDVNSNQLIAGLTQPYSSIVKNYLRIVQNEQKVEIGFISQLNTLIGQEFGRSVLELLESSHVSSHDVTGIGSHGQTICHNALAEIPYTVQLGCAHTIAEITKIPVVADFRTRDLVVGGQGAPFAPIYHQALFKDYELPLAVINIGGIANITYLTGQNSAVGYDVGPGNCLMDLWIKKKLDKPYDANGEWASQGEVISPLLNGMLADPYFSLGVPKSIGKEYFSEHWIHDHLHQQIYDDIDVQSTLLALTAKTISDSLLSSKLNLKNAFLCGGGVHNNVLIKKIKEHLPHIAIESTESVGINPDYIEAMMFAWLAEKTLKKTPLNLTKITGARAPAILGAVYPVAR
jgi:anhydro-N-acetylmuramic acid kinase